MSPRARSVTVILREEIEKLKTRVRVLGNAERSLAEVTAKLDETRIELYKRRDDAFQAGRSATKAEAEAADFKKRFDDLDHHHSIIVTLVALLAEAQRRAKP